ncbi:MAG: aminopeptidase [Muribaculaceae bacterium]|nr:aminopeptidase [Muribaculaceae bacterium]
MNTKVISVAVCAAAVLSAAAQPTPAKPDSLGFVFTDVLVIPTNSVKSQDAAGTCWCYSVTSQLEDEILKNGGPAVDLSEMFTVRHVYADKAARYIRLGGEGNFGQGGALSDVPDVFVTYGALPESAYPGLNYGEETHIHSELEAVLKAYVDAVNKHPNRRLSTAWKQGLEGILDAYLGKVPETFEVNGKTYTPKSYAESLGINPAEIVPFTSFTHHPFYTQVPLELADNWMWERSYNVPMQELKEIVDNALDKGYSVVWGADVSEPGFKWRNGVALFPAEKDEASLEGTELSRWVALTPAERARERYNINGPVKEVDVTQEMRQTMFDRQETTEDHAMVIVGKAVDQKGNPYYKVKNSWGDAGHIYGGYFYVSVPYFLAKTISLSVNKNGVPAEIAKKSGLK